MQFLTTDFFTFLLCLRPHKNFSIEYFDSVFFSCDAETLLISLHIKEIGFQETSYFGERTPIAHCEGWAIGWAEKHFFSNFKKTPLPNVVFWYQKLTV